MTPENSRTCSGCTLCCKLPSIAALEKPAGVWCRHCAPASGCTIHAQRPQVCRDFVCGWLQGAGVGDHWFPARSRMIIVREASPRRLVVHVDPERPGAWSREPWIGDLQAWASDLVPQGVPVLVLDRTRVHGVLQSGPVNLGQNTAGGDVVLEQRPGGLGWRYRRLPAGYPS
jgi:uncharacterized protein